VRRVRSVFDTRCAIRRALLLALSLVGAGCGGGTEAPDAAVLGDAAAEPDLPYVEATCTPAADDTFCPMYAAAFCAGHFDCCTATEEPGLRYATMELCIQRTTCICVAGRSGDAFAAGRVTFDAPAAEVLLARVRDGADGCSALPPGSLEVEAALVGTLVEGASCSPDGTDYSNLFACAAGLYCYVTDFGGGPSPAAADCRRYRAESEACDASGMTCAPGLYCADGASIDDPGICRAQRGGGMACANDFECASDLCDALAGDTCSELDRDDTWCVDGEFGR